MNWAVYCQLLNIVSEIFVFVLRPVDKFRHFCQNEEGNLIFSFCVCRETVVSSDYGQVRSTAEGQTNNGKIHYTLYNVACCTVEV